MASQGDTAIDSLKTDKVSGSSLADMQTLHSFLLRIPKPNKNELAAEPLSPQALSLNTAPTPSTQLGVTRSDTDLAILKNVINLHILTSSLDRLQTLCVDSITPLTLALVQSLTNYIIMIMVGIASDLN